MHTIQAICCVPRPNRICLRASGTYPTRGYRETDIQYKRDPKVTHPEGYKIRVYNGTVTVAANTRQGEFYAKQTLRQIMSSASVVPEFCICDEPAFAYRGFMIDCARHFFPMDAIKKMIDAAAMFKLNTFHWHLTDDQGWRIEIAQYPNLTKTGATRPFSHFGRDLDSNTHTGFYTKAEIREIVSYCAERCIEVIPEIDMPGHTCAAIAAYPTLSCRGETITVKTHGGIFHDILCAGKEETFQFLFRVLDEVMELFPSHKIHIGGDEAPKTRWNACPDCQARMQAEHITDAEGLQGYFTNRIADYLEAHGFTPIVWNEALKSGNLKNNVLVQLWMDKGGYCVRRANRGGKVIISDFYHYYADYPYGMTPTDKTYLYNPLPEGLSFAGERNILGVEAPIWTEHVADFQRMGYMCYPRFAAVAETGWTKPLHKNYADFERRFACVKPLLEETGVIPAPFTDWVPGKTAGLLDMLRFWRGSTNANVRKQALFPPDRK